MIIKLVTACITLFLILSCADDDSNFPLITPCEGTNTIEDLDWLKSLIEEKESDESDLSKYFYIEIAEFNSETVFIDNNCCPVCNTVIPVYNCEGEFLDFLNSEITMGLKNRRVIFKKDDFACSLE